MIVFNRDVDQQRAMGALAGLTLFGVLMSVGSGLVPRVGDGGGEGVLPSLGGGFVGGVFVAGAACASFVNWRRHSGTWDGWRLATGGLLACQALAVTLVALATPPPRTATAVAVLLATAAAGMVVVLLPLLQGHRGEHAGDDGCALALGMGLMAAGYLLLQLPMATPPPAAMLAVVAMLLLTHLSAVLLVLRNKRMPRQVEALLALTVAVVAVGVVVSVAAPAGGVWEASTHVARAAVGAAWLAVAWHSLQVSIEQDRRRADTAHEVLTSTTRERREQMHELRSTIAGLVSGSALLADPAVPSETRERLLGSVRRELDRMDRMLSGREGKPVELDLDTVLGPMLELQQLKGREVEVHGSGTVVMARPDALAEVLNILVDNAATHGGVDRSVVELVRHEDTVDILVSDAGRGIPRDQRDHIFEWGRHGSASPGEGIGLHVARRLVTEDGGDLRLADRDGTGSSFVISLPAARRALDDLDLTSDQNLEAGHAGCR